MNPETLLVNTVLPVFLMSTLVAALFAYWFAFAAALVSHTLDQSVAPE